MTMFGHQSVFLTGPIRPSAPWCVSVHSIHGRDFAIKRSSLRTYASGMSPSTKYGPRSQLSPVPPSQPLLGPTSGQNSSR